MVGVHGRRVGTQRSHLKPFRHARFGHDRLGVSAARMGAALTLRRPAAVRRGKQSDSAYVGVCIPHGSAERAPHVGPVRGRARARTPTSVRYLCGAGGALQDRDSQRHVCEWARVSGLSLIDGSRSGVIPSAECARRAGSACCIARASSAHPAPTRSSFTDSMAAILPCREPAPPQLSAAADPPWCPTHRGVRPSRGLSMAQWAAALPSRAWPGANRPQAGIWKVALYDIIYDIT